MKNIILEGARGTGKSSVAQYLRENTSNSTLINFTGFNVQGVEGLRMVVDYYTAWFGFFLNLLEKGKDMTFIHDRFFFSERVYANLYKDYAEDFNYFYESFLELTATTFNELDVYYLVPTSEETLTRNLSREKELFNGVEESVGKSLEQDKEYKRMFEDIRRREIPNIRITFIPLRNRTIEEVGNEILELSGINLPLKL